ncbi:TolC family protein [Olivibacter sitiensis]|uniref:TolC family protein n=1 Tax=Olivibacter sitiensis TaxID=376470 RepID=UPI000A07565E|nr:TolC family protein [Olivibacter sitiensis]
MRYSLFLLFISFISRQAMAQDNLANAGTDPLGQATLQQCIDYALLHQTEVRQALIDEEIGKRDIASALSGWFPQINADASYNHNIKIPTNVIGDQVIQFGQKNTSALTLQADQKILDPSLIQASKAAKYVKIQNAQNTENAKINTIVSVSKAFYDILTSEEQLKIIDENIVRLEKQLKDARAQYETGLVDKTDFKRAQIALSTTKADRKRTEEMLKYKYAYLKELVGLSIEQELKLAYDSGSMEQQMLIDTTENLHFRNRIEFRQLETGMQLQKLNTSYNKWTFLPNLSAFYNYGWDYRTNAGFSDLYRVDYPRSVLGVTLSLPIFQGTKRLQEIRKSKLQEQRLAWDMVNTKNQINTQYQQALATYKSNLNDWKTAQENVELSKEVYNTIKLQYDEGIKTYLDLMTAETDLRTTQINYLNAMYAVLSGKLDVQQALGSIIPANDN